MVTHEITVVFPFLLTMRVIISVTAFTTNYLKLTIRYFLAIKLLEIER